MISPEVLVGLDCLEENSQNPEHENLIVSCLEELDNSFQWLLFGYGSFIESKMRSYQEFVSIAWTQEKSRSISTSFQLSWAGEWSRSTMGS